MDRAWVRLAVSVVVGVIVALVLGGNTLAVMTGWVATQLFYVGSTWLLLGRMNADQTKAHATQADPTHAISLLVLLVACLASLAGVAVLLHAGVTRTGPMPIEAIVGVAAVLGSWLVVPTVYSVHYARLYHQQGKGIDFNSDEAPDYLDFAYFGFNLAMTYQVSDTDVSNKLIRRAVLRQCLLSYLFGAVVIGTTVNLVIQIAAPQTGG